MVRHYGLSVPKVFIAYSNLKRLVFLWLPFLQNPGERPSRNHPSAILPSGNGDTFRWFSLHQCQNDPVTKEADLLTMKVNTVTKEGSGVNNKLML